MAADVITRTARQVRLPGTPGHPEPATHGRARARFTPVAGHFYRTVCGMTLTATEGAMLTTREVSCPVCLRGGR